MKVLNAAPESMRLLIEETEPSYANALRRVLVSDVPKMAIEDVEFHLGPIRGEEGREYKGGPPLLAELTPPRLALVPTPTALGLYNRREDCPTCHGEGCPNCTIIYSVNKRGPGIVTSGDLEPIGDAKLRPADQKIPIVKLGDGQAMLVYATAVLGNGKDHAKWQSTHGVGYRYYPTLKAGTKTLDALDPAVPFCESHMQSTATEEEETLELASDCKTCKKFIDQYKVESVKAGNDPTRIVMEFETDGSLSAKAVLVAALDILAKRFSELASHATGLA